MDTIRTMPAQRKHAREIAELIYQTEDFPESVFGVGSREEILQRLTKLVKRHDTRYSYKYTTVAIVGNEVAGAIIALPHNLISNLDKNTSKAILKSSSLIEKLKYIWFMVLELGFKESDEGEFYISNLSTFSKFQGKGIATLLMKEAEKSAKKQNITKCSLIVNTQKDKAFNLYKKLNYNVLEKVNYSGISYFRMIKDVKLS